MENKKCPYAEEFNGDGIEETDGFDYYSCSIKNNEELKKYGKYCSIDNECIEDDYENCLYFLKKKGE